MRKNNYRKEGAAVLSVVIAAMLAFTVFASLPNADSNDGMSLGADPLYNTGDIAVINSIIDNNGLVGWTTAPTDGSATAAHFTTWTTVGWSTDADNKRIKSLSLENKNLTGALDVSGLAELTHLSLIQNHITAIDVSGLEKLEELDVANNDLTALDVTSNIALTLLSCGNNELTQLDVSNNTALAYLDCRSNCLTELNVINNIAITGLYCEYNYLTELNVTGLSLYYLHVQGNYIPDKSDVKGFPVTGWDGSSFIFDLQYAGTPVTFTAVQTGGTSGIANSTGIVITFSSEVSGLDESDITITNGTGSVTKGTLLTGSGLTWTIALTAVATQGNVIVEIDDFAAGDFVVVPVPQTVAVYKDTRTPVTFTAAQTGGSFGIANSTGIVITFNTAVTGLAASDITVTSGTGSATKGGVTGSGTTWTLALTDVTEYGNVTVSVGDFGAFKVTTISQMVTVFKDTRVPITFTAVQTGGTSGIADSTGIVITFSEAVSGLLASDITITNGTGSATKGELTGSGTAWTIELTDVTAQGDVTVSITNIGTSVGDPTPQSVAVYKDTRTPVTFTAVQVGGTSGTANSTGIVITFSAAVANLAASDITITNGTGSATKGALAGYGTTYTVELTGVSSQGDVTVSVGNFDTFKVTTAPQTVAVYKATGGGGGGGGADNGDGDGGINMMLIVAIVAVVAILVVAYMFVLRPRMK